MENNFEEIYKMLKDEYGSKYAPVKSNVTTKHLLKVFFVWIIFNLSESVIRILGYSDSIVSLIIKLISCGLIFYILYKLLKLTNKNLEYWKTASNFKFEVGKQFFTKMSENMIYTPDRKEIDNEYVKCELEKNYNNPVIIDVEERLTYQNIEMYTVRFDYKNNDGKKRRKTGILAIVKDCNKKYLELAEDEKKLFDSNEISIYEKDNSVYLVFDAKEVFFFNNLDFFNEKEFKDDYERINNIVKLSEKLK